MALSQSSTCSQVSGLVVHADLARPQSPKTQAPMSAVPVKADTAFQGTALRSVGRQTRSMAAPNVALKDLVASRDAEVGSSVSKLVSEGSEDLDSIATTSSDLSEVVDVVEEDAGGANIRVRKASADSHLGRVRLLAERANRLWVFFCGDRSRELCSMEAMLTCGNWTQTLGCVGKVRLGGGGVSSDKTVFGAHNGLRRSSSAGLSSVAKELRVVSSFRRRQAANVGAGDLSVRAASGNGAAPKQFDYDVVIIGAGVGGHGAALHAVEKGLKTAIIEGDVVGGTCVNRGCVPSKALLAVSGRMRELRDEHHLKALGIQVGAANFDRQSVADHANNLATKIRGNLTNSMKALGVDILTGVGSIVAPQVVKYGKIGFSDKTVTARNIIIATGSVPFVPPGIEVDGKTVFTSDHALKLEWIPDWITIVGSGYIGLEFSDVYTALGSEVTFVEALDGLMPGFDPEIGKLAQRILINPRKIDYHVGVLAKKITPAKDGKPVQIELVDTKTKEPKDILEVDAALIATGRSPFTKGLGLEKINVTTQRGFVPVDERMQVLDSEGKPVPHLYCIGDANGKMMLAHAASAQGISVIEQIAGRDNILNHNSVPAACFTHPEISMVGLTEPQARALGTEEGFKVSVAKTSFKANTKALAENEGEGLAKMIYRPDTGEILGVHILGLHAADLIHEASNAIAMGNTIRDIKFAVHAHPTLSEVLDELFKAAKLDEEHAAVETPKEVLESVSA